ncbi:MAG: hypothetical protein AAFS06_02715 [Cyanobacteria bacterium J06631_12]
MVTPLQKFRTEYPLGSLTADLISMHDGQYVVRAAIALKGDTLATGLASSVDVHIAEDKARDRALAVLGIFPDPSATATAETSPHQAVSSLPIATESSTPDTVDAVSTAAEPVQNLSPPEDLQPQDLQPQDLQPQEDNGPPIEDITEEPMADPVSKPSAAAIALENFNTSATPVDLSDVIAQTDVELTRLGWTSTQGREYLEKTYGKRSRQQLTDEELMSFLLYLEAL